MKAPTEQATFIRYYSLTNKKTMRHLFYATAMLISVARSMADLDTAADVSAIKGNLEKLAQSDATIEHDTSYT